VCSILLSRAKSWRVPTREDRLTFTAPWTTNEWECPYATTLVSTGDIFTEENTAINMPDIFSFYSRTYALKTKDFVINT
jgi:hypothetical protein